MALVFKQTKKKKKITLLAVLLLLLLVIKISGFAFKISVFFIFQTKFLLFWLMMTIINKVVIVVVGNNVVSEVANYLFFSWHIKYNLVSI